MIKCLIAIAIITNSHYVPQYDWYRGVLVKQNEGGTKYRVDFKIDFMKRGIKDLELRWVDHNQCLFEED